MHTGKIISFLLLLIATCAVCATQQATVPAELKDTVLRDVACNSGGDPASADPALSAVTIRAGGKEAGTIIAVQGECHCQGANCDTLVYLRKGDQYRLALHEKYASLHPMKIVKRGMTSLTGKFEVNAEKAETTVYDWDGKDYRASLCATVTRRGKLPPSIAQHPCKKAN
jgi:hypothetical protein